MDMYPTEISMGCMYPMKFHVICTGIGLEASRWAGQQEAYIADNENWDYTRLEMGHANDTLDMLAVTSVPPGGVSEVGLGVSQASDASSSRHCM